ncbi:MAG: CPBP family intramembrane glutamic endopeptidase [Bacteroidales bacterium]|jgi:membrane protease YdiL (CAAX protease family)|nr:CPBP family intramembrane glutamic endopeptidase [Bacteroidales bacterium]
MNKMFFESALTGKNAVWRYLLMFLVVFVVTNTIGALPLVIVIVLKGIANPEVLDTSTENLMDLSVYGIDENTGLVLMIFPFLLGLLSLVLLMKPLHGRTFMSLFNGGGNIRWKRFFTGALVWLVLMGIYLYFSIQSNPDNFSLNNTSKSLIWLVIIALLLIPFQTTFEEILFRGYLMQGAGAWFRNKWMPLIITSLFFGLMHAANPEIREYGFWIMMPQYIFYGLVFGLITIIDNGIEIAMGAHAANNIFLSVFVTQKSSALQTAALYEQKVVYPWSDFLSLVFVSLIFFVLMAIINKWCFRGVFKLKL